MSKIIVNGSLIPSVKNAPLDIRTRINTMAEVASIQVPFVGMIFYVMDEEKFYVVKSLKGSMVGNIELKDTTIDTFEPLTAEVDLSDMATKDYVDEAIKNVQVGEDVNLSDYAKKAFVEEQIAAIEHPQYDDSELKERVEVLENLNLEAKPYIDKDGMLVLCGCPAVARGVGEEVHVIVRFFNDAEDKFVFTKDEFAKLRICVGYGAEGVGTKRNIAETSFEMYDIDRAYVIDGGSQITGEIGTVNIIAERVNYIHAIQGARAMNGGERNIVHNFNVKVKDVELLNILFCGGNGYSVTWNSNVVIENTSINSLHGGGSNGYTNSTVIEINGGTVETFYGVNRGIVNKYKLIVNDGQIKNFWAACDEGNPVVNAVELELIRGQIDKFNLGISGDDKLSSDAITGYLTNRFFIISGNVSMLEDRVLDEGQQEGNVQVDLSEYAKVEFVEEQIAAIEHPEYDDAELRAEIKKVDNKIAAQQRFEISNVPAGTLVDYREKEIRIMCPADAEFKQQEVGAGGNANMYYMTFTTYFPENAVTFKEGDKGVLVDEVLNFENTTGAGVDKFGRKFKQHWFALASFNGSVWTYYGKTSSLDKYIGWTYCVEWYDENGIAIGSDCIRLNLSNEACHNAMQPYHGFRVAEKAYVDSQIAAIELKEGPAGQDGVDGQDGKDFTYDMFTAEQLEALRGPQGADGAAGQDGKDGVDGKDGKDFTFDMFTEEQLEALRGPAGADGINGENGKDGVNGVDGIDGKDGEQGPAGQDGISVVAVAIENNHLMITLSNDQVLDAGELPAGQGGDGAVNPEIEEKLEEAKAEIQDLKNIKQLYLDSTYGVEFEWLYIIDQEHINSYLPEFSEDLLVEFYEEWYAVADDEVAMEEWIIKMYEEDIYRMYVLKIVDEFKFCNRYALLPLDGHSIQPNNPDFANWTPTRDLTTWNWDLDNGFFLDAAPGSTLTFAFGKVKEEYRGKF